MPEEYGEKPVSLYHALDTHNVAIKPKQNHVEADYGQACIFADIRSQLVQLRSLADAIDLCAYLSNEGHSSTRIVGGDVSGYFVEVIFYFQRGLNAHQSVAPAASAIA